MGSATFYQQGSQLTVISTEHFLNSPSPNTVAGAYQFWVDVSAMLKADILEVRVREKVNTAGSQQLAWISTYANAQVEGAVFSGVLLLLGSWDFTIKQTAGSARTFGWSIRQVS